MKLPDKATRQRLADVMANGQYVIPEGQGIGGTGAPGLYLERLLGLETSNTEAPDAGEWEVKFSSGTALLTMFHKSPLPRGKAMRYIINEWGWTGRNGRPSFRHTICGESDRFEVVNESGAIRVRRKGQDDIVPHWSHDVLVTAFARKMGKLILVHGSYHRPTRTVRYDSAEYLAGGPKTTQIIRAVSTGKICIDFDAYIKTSGAIRDHGTKFRIDPVALPSLYNEREKVK